MSNQDNSFSKSSIITMFVLAVLSPLVVLLDSFTGFTEAREHPIFFTLYYIVTIFDIFYLIKKLIKKLQKYQKEKKEKETYKKLFDPTDNDDLQKIFTFSFSSNQYFIEKYIGFHDTEITIPRTFHGFPIVGLQKELLMNCDDLKKLTVLAEIAFIPKRFAYGCHNLETVTLPENILFLLNECFSSCHSLKEIHGAKDIIGIAKEAFAYSNLSHFNQTTFLSGIENDAFAGCNSLISVTLPAPLKKIPENCFLNCKNLKEVILPSTLEIIEKNAFKNCNSLSSILIPKSVTSIGEFAIPYDTLIYCYPDSYAQEHLRKKNKIESAELYQKQF